jgi:UDP-N-acetylglucosamine 2-epimerase
MTADGLDGSGLRLGLAQGLVPGDPALLTPALAREIAALGVQRLVTHFEGGRRCSPAVPERTSRRC